jgi:hypothetical protein
MLPILRYCSDARLSRQRYKKEEKELGRMKEIWEE